MKRILAVLLTVVFVAIPSFAAQTPPPAPVTDKKAEPKKPEKGEQEPRPVAQEQQKQDSQKKDAPAPSAATQPSPNPIAAEGAAEKKEDKKWDVNNPPGPQYDVPIDVTEGTWLSLDVSPDGNEIAFDLLGDIYTIPMSGGEAKSITTGIAWDMQPRYSPNGKWIAYTSDRAGGDNIWIMNRDGSKPQQVT
ncbi:MAG TPA: amidohydrolase, partial [Thermoanaerobaculia bacterium]|nr:amidohydrolase [Thermoanaerobaculia bacterium]